MIVSQLECMEAVRFKSGPAYRLGTEEDIQRDILMYGPVQALIHVQHDFFHYKSGVYRTEQSIQKILSRFHIGLKKFNNKIRPKVLVKF